MKCFFILFSIFVSSFVCGQTITGLVSFEDSYRLAKNLTIYTNDGIRTVTDSLGNYSLQTSPSTRRIIFKQPFTFWDARIEVLLADELRKDTVINVTINRRVIYIDELEVVAHITPRQQKLYYSEKDGVKRLTIDSELISIEKKWSVLEHANSYNMFFWAQVIYDNITYPEELWKLNIEGRTWVQFKIDVNGSLADLKIIRSLADEIDEEIFSTFELMPNWSSYSEWYCSLVGGANFQQLLAQRGAINYFETFTLPIKFRIEIARD